MSLIERIDGELKAARLARDAERRDALSLVLNALQAAQKELRRPLSDEEELQVLRVVWQLESDATGTLRPVKPGRPTAAGRGAIAKDGVVQLGLTGGEIAGLRQRIEALLEDVDAGKVPLF